MDGNERWFSLPSSDEDVFALTDDIAMENRILSEDHKAILDMSMLLQKMEGRGVEDLAVETALNVIEEMVEGHFIREENVMRSAEYQSTDDHAAIHTRFRTQLKEMIALRRDGESPVIGAIGHFVASWLRKHIVNEDHQYESWIRGVAVDQRPLAQILVEATGS